jgi:hypothetical protein
MFGRITSTHSFESEQEEMQTAEYTFDGVGWKKKLVVIWRNYSQFQHVGLLHLVSACLFLVFYFLGNHALGNLRLLPGFVALIVTPGVVLSMALPKSLRNLGFTVVLGLLLNTILVQIQISLKLLFDITIPLYAWLLIVNTAIVLFGLGILWLTDNEDSDNIELGFKVDSTLAFILIFALVLRVVLMGFGAQSIAPDASLYSDYARSILDGSFQTNVIGDNRVYTLWNQTDYSFHQGLTYLFALSWLLLTPGISGPTLILTLSGVFLIVIAFNITSFYFSKRAAYVSNSSIIRIPLIGCIWP